MSPRVQAEAPPGTAALLEGLAGLIHAEGRHLEAAAAEACDRVVAATTHHADRLREALDGVEAPAGPDPDETTAAAARARHRALRAVEADTHAALAGLVTDALTAAAGRLAPLVDVMEVLAPPTTPAEQAALVTLRTAATASVEARARTLGDTIAGAIGFSAFPLMLDEPDAITRLGDPDQRRGRVRPLCAASFASLLDPFDAWLDTRVPR